MDKLPPRGSSSKVVLEQVHQPRTTSNTTLTISDPTTLTIPPEEASQGSSGSLAPSIELGFRFGSREGLVSTTSAAGLILENYRETKRKNKPVPIGSGELETFFSSATPLPPLLDGIAGLLDEEGVEPLHGVPLRFPSVRDRKGVEHDRLFINLLRNLRFLLGNEARTATSGESEFGEELKVGSFNYIPAKNPKLLLDLRFPPNHLQQRGYTGSFTIKEITKCLRLDDIKATTDESGNRGVNLGNITLTYFLDETQDIKFEAIFNPFTKIIFIRIFKKKLEEGSFAQMYESEYRLDQESKQIFFRPYTEELAQIPFPIIKERFMGKPKKFVNPYALIAQVYSKKLSFEDIEKGRVKILKRILTLTLDSTQQAILQSMLDTDESVKEKNSELLKLYELYKTGTKERPIKDILSFDQEFTTTQWASPKLTPNSVKAFQRFGKLDPRIVLVRKKERQQLIVKESEMLDGDKELQGLTKALLSLSKKFVQREVEFYAPTKFGYKRPFTLTDILKSRYYSNYLFEELGITEQSLLKWFNGIEEFRSNVFLTVSLFCHFIDPDNSGFVDMDKEREREFKPHTSLSLFKSYPVQFKQFLVEPVKTIPCLQFFETRKFTKGDAQKNMLGGVFGTDVSECPVSAISPKREFQYCTVFEALEEEDCRLEIALSQGSLNERARERFIELITGLKAPDEVVVAVEDDIEERLEELAKANFPSLNGLSVTRSPLPEQIRQLPRGSFAAVAASKASDLLVGKASDLLPGAVAPTVPNPEQIRQLQITERELEQGKSELQQILATFENTQEALNEELRRRSRPNEGGALRSEGDLGELYRSVSNLREKIRLWEAYINRKESKLLELRGTLQQTVPQRAYLPPSSGISPSVLLPRGSVVSRSVAELPSRLPETTVAPKEESWETVGPKETLVRAPRVPVVSRPVAELPSRLPETTVEEDSDNGPQRKVFGSSKAKGFMAPNALKELLTKQNLQELISNLEESTDQEFDKKLLRLITDGRNDPQIRNMLYNQIFGPGKDFFEPEVKTKLRKLFVGSLKDRKLAMLQILAKINIEEYDLAKETKFRADNSLGKRLIPEIFRKDFDRCCKLPKLSELKEKNIPKDLETSEFELVEDSSSPSFKIVKAFLDWFSNKLEEPIREAHKEGLTEEDLLLIKSVFRNASLIQDMVRKIISSDDSNLSPEERQLKDDLQNEDETKKRNAIFFIAKNNLGLLGQKFKESELGQRKKKKDTQVKQDQEKENLLRDQLLEVEAENTENEEKLLELSALWKTKDAEAQLLEAEIKKLIGRKKRSEEENKELAGKKESLIKVKGERDGVNSKKMEGLNKRKSLKERKAELDELLQPFDADSREKNKVFKARTAAQAKNNNIVELLKTFEAINSKLEKDLITLGRLKGKKKESKQLVESIKDEANESFPLDKAEKLIEENEKTLDLETKARIAKLKVLILKYNILKDKINIHYDEFYGGIESENIKSAKQKLESLETHLVGLEKAESTAQAAYESQLEVDQIRVEDEGEEGGEREYISIHINEGGAGGGRNINIEGYFSELSRQEQNIVRELRVEKENPKFGIRNKYLSAREEYFRVKYEKYKLKYLSLKSEYFR